MDDQIFDAVKDVIEDNPEDFAEAVDEVPGAKNYLVGCVLQETGGSADPGEAMDAIEQFIEQAGPDTFTFPYVGAYTFNEKVSELGVPDTSDGRDAFKYMPHVNLEMEYDGSGESEVTGVEIDGTMHDIEEREP